jgi:hypothetical protein
MCSGRYCKADFSALGSYTATMTLECPCRRAYYRGLESAIFAKAGGVFTGEVSRKQVSYQTTALE